MIFDSNFLIDFLNGKKDAVNKYLELEKAGEPFFITSVSVFEVIQGISKSYGLEKARKILDFLKSIPCFSLDFESAKIAGEISQELSRHGSIVDVGDMLIAGIAKSKNQAILTKNTKHFSRIPELKFHAY